MSTEEDAFPPPSPAEGEHPDGGGEEVVVTVVHCWSSPRSRSTALLYSFESRGSSSCTAIDEPLYRRWLVEKGDAVARPYKRELAEGVPPEGKESDAAERRRWGRERGTLSERIAEGVRSVVASSSSSSSSAASASGDEEGDGEDQREAEAATAIGRVVFLKHMAKHAHLYDFRNERESAFGGVVRPPRGRVVLRHRHVLLIRDPVAVLSSWAVRGDVHGNNPTPDEVGTVPLLGIYSSLSSRGPGGEGRPGAAVVLDSDALATDPRGTLKDLCRDLDIGYTDRMLRWEGGPHECDGPWADWWYADVHKSTGWFGHNGSEEEAAAAAEGGESGRGGGGGDGDGCYPRRYVPSRTRRYRTLDPSLVDTLRASMPAYQYLSTLARGYERRGGPGPSSSSPEEEILADGDPRRKNASAIMVWVGPPGRGRLVPRDMAGVSPYDSSLQIDGAVCRETVRVSDGRVLLLEECLGRLFRSAEALGFGSGTGAVSGGGGGEEEEEEESDDDCNLHTKEEVTEAVFRTLASNGMRDGVRVRLVLTRGEQCTFSSTNPNANVYGTTLIVLPEWESPTEASTADDDTEGVDIPPFS